MKEFDSLANKMENVIERTFVRYGQGKIIAIFLAAILFLLLSVNTSQAQVVNNAGSMLAADNQTEAPRLIRSNPFPDVSFTANTKAGQGPLMVTFLNETPSDTNIIGYKWEFGDKLSPENTSVERNPSHTFTTPGKYTVKLTVTTKDGYKSTYMFPEMINVETNPVADLDE